MKRIIIILAILSVILALIVSGCVTGNVIAKQKKITPLVDIYDRKECHPRTFSYQCNSENECRAGCVDYCMNRGWQYEDSDHYGKSGFPKGVAWCNCQCSYYE